MPDRPGGDPVIQLRDVVIDYRGLRPLRIKSLDVGQGECVALLGFDATMADVLVKLVIGAAVPDSGEVRVLGEPTTAIGDGRQWLTALDRFGLLGDRSVLVDQFTAEENLVLPLSLAPAGTSPDTGSIARRLADEVGLSADQLASSTESLSPEARMRLRLGRAVVLDPRVLLAEHPNVSLTPEDAITFAKNLSSMASRRRLATIVMTMDPAFAEAATSRVLILQPATGELKPAQRWRGWLPRLR